MKTRTAPWDYNRFSIAPDSMNDTCPKCGKPCHSVVVVNEKLYFCCGVIKIDVELTKAAKTIREEMNQILFVHPVQEAKAEYCLELAVTAQERAQSEPRWKQVLEANAAFYMMGARKYLGGVYTYQPR